MTLNPKTKNSVGKRSSKKEKKSTKDTKFSGAKIFSNRVEQYDVVNGIGKADAKINIGQLVRVDAAKAAKKAWKLFGGKIVKNMVAA